MNKKDIQSFISLLMGDDYTVLVNRDIKTNNIDLITRDYYNGINKSVFKITGVKDLMVAIEILSYVISALEFDKNARAKIVLLLEDLEHAWPYSRHLPEVCNSQGMIVKFTADRKYEALLSFDNNNFIEQKFYTNPELKYFNDNNCHEIGCLTMEMRVKCWEFVMNIDGQSRLNPKISLMELSKQFKKAEIFYICYLMQYSAKTWVRDKLNVMKQIEELNK